MTEARFAIAGGCHVLDIKDPDQGSLGRARPSIISDILDFSTSITSKMPLSIALGELTDWADSTARTDIRADWNHVAYYKLGPSGIADPSDWQRQFTQARHILHRAAITRPRAIAVLYADAHGARSFMPCTSRQATQDFVQRIGELGCAGLLIDTWDKSGPSLNELLNSPASEFRLQLRYVLETCREAGVISALAGRLQHCDIKDLLAEEFTPDLFAVRSAVCEQANRQNAVSTEKVRDLVGLLAETHVSAAHAWFPRCDAISIPVESLPPHA
ncbi:MAG: hypothetical protein KDA76_16410 [Planctomycetaceae bacterium]|nr:hypothetical protein [Planctomycetaceae bacterium]